MKESKNNIRYANSHKKGREGIEELEPCPYCKDKKRHPSVDAMLKNRLSSTFEGYHAARRGKVTASKISSIQNENAFKRDTQMLDEFVNGSQFKGNECTRWGEDNEPHALNKFCEVTSHDLIPEIDGKTLILHPKYNYIAASPDGITYCGKMVEIKCPWSKSVGTRAINVPSQYKAQLHLQQHVCGMDETYFVTYAPKGYRCGKTRDLSREETINIVKFMRDSKWMERNLPKIKLFLLNVEYGNNNKNKNLSQIYNNLF